MSNIRKYLEDTDIVLTGPAYVNVLKTRYCNHMSNIRKYLEVTDIVVTCPTYVNI